MTCTRPLWRRNQASNPGTFAGEVTQEFRLLGNTYAPDAGGVLLDLLTNLSRIVKVALRVHAPRESQAHQFHAVIGFAAVILPLAKHHRTNFHATNAAFQIESIAPVSYTHLTL